MRALAEEIIVSTEHSLPIWNGVVTKAWCKMLDLGGVQPTKSRKLAADIRQRLQEYREYVWKTRTCIKHGEEEPEGREDERNAIHPYKNTFTPARSPNRHDKVQTTITDYIKDDTPEWYVEVDRAATLIEERARCARKKRDQTADQNAQGNPQRQLTQQTLTGPTHKKKKSSTPPTKKMNKIVKSWRTQYINGNGQVTPLPRVSGVHKEDE